ncbi:LOW QUALITY PROTEIN: hypothetical protein OSB04_005461 [Centaurea solstitialis]|uniref:Uncharacterized protein n=1 Tax=Centaurea solstitialis TaxID=347529 RepID=A0AA38WS43_9ASTR|nr:LOW QUALITY PROTEIN: hypothetical protein OSB04_005461 [Centaurea solstitialis]
MESNYVFPHFPPPSPAAKPPSPAAKPPPPSPTKPSQPPPHPVPPPSPPHLVPPPPHSIPPRSPPHMIPPPPPPHSIPPRSPPHMIPPPPPHSIPPRSPPHMVPPPPPHSIPPRSPPHIIPPPPPPSPSNHTTIIVVVFVSCGGVFFLAFIMAALWCFLKKKRKTVQKAENVHIDEHKTVKESIVQGPNGTERVMLSVEDDIHIEEDIRKSEIENFRKGLHLNSGMIDAGDQASTSTTAQHHHGQKLIWWPLEKDMGRPFPAWTRDVGWMLDPKIKTALAAGNHEVKRRERGRSYVDVQEQEMHAMLALESKEIVWKAVPFIFRVAVEKTWEVENIYKRYTKEIFEIKFWIYFMPNPMSENIVVIGMDRFSWNGVIVDCAANWFGRRVRVGESWSSTARGASQGGKLFSREDEKVPAAWVHGLFGLRFRLVIGKEVSVVREFPGIRSIGLPADRRVEFRFNVTLGSTPVAETPYRSVSPEL